MAVREIEDMSAHVRIQGKQRLLFGINFRMIRESVNSAILG